MRHIKQLSLEGFELKIEISPEDKKDITVYPCYNLENNFGSKEYQNQRRAYCHRIFAMAFIKCPSLSLTYTVDHINEDKLDYSIQNLRWVSATDNMSHVSNTASSKGKAYKIFTGETYV